MANPRGFLEVKKEKNKIRSVDERLKDFLSVDECLSDDKRILQASRCMDCGISFCHWACPLGNLMPEWQDMIYLGRWKDAYDILSSTNNFPEFTGKVCPALCEASCVLSIDDKSVTIKDNELAVVEKAFSEGYIQPNLEIDRAGKKVAVIGSGPAGLACADQLNKKGYTVIVYEKENKPGGLLRYGIPDFKLEKHLIDRRIELMEKEGIIFETGITVGNDLKLADLKRSFDAICITVGAKIPRDISVQGRSLKGIYFAMDYLVAQNRFNSGEMSKDKSFINAKDKNVVVIGGGDTGSDCVGTANRQGAKSVVQIEILPKPPVYRNEDMPWPFWPTLLKTSTSHEEGCDRLWSIMTKEFIGEKDNVKEIEMVKVNWDIDYLGNKKMTEVKNSNFKMDADLVFLALGFTKVEQDLFNDKHICLEKDEKGNIKVDDSFQTNIPGIFAAGDASRGPSLVVKAIADGRAAAEGIDCFIRNQ